MTDLEQVLQEAQPNNPKTTLTALSSYNTALETIVTRSNSSRQYRDICWRYYQPLVSLLDETVQCEGWEILEEVIRQYNPSKNLLVPYCSHIVVNVVGRFIIRTRIQDGITTVPEIALKYLRAFSGQYDHKLAQTEAHCYGWGIAHPTHSVTAYLREVVVDKPWWVQQTLEHAFYADQHAATELLRQLITEESLAFTVPLAPERDVTEDRFLLECLVGPDSKKYRPTVPRFWSTIEDYADEFEWDATVEEQLRTLVEETGIAKELPTDWTFQELAF